jgi:hypothetical protein
MEILKQHTQIACLMAQKMSSIHAAQISTICAVIAVPASLFTYFFAYLFYRVSRCWDFYVKSD